MTKLRLGIALVLFLFAAYFPVFLHLDTLSLRIFDESRVGMNAMEMAEHGNWLVPHYAGKPDMWNLKPPLMVWLEVLSMKVLGYNTLAIRLPSAFAGLATILFLLWFGAKVLKDRSIGFLSALVLMTTPGFISIHVSRTGEYDALLCLFLLAYALSFFRYLHCDGVNQKKILWYFGIFFALALFTKGIAGIFFLPGLALYALTQKKILWMLRQPQLYIVGLSSLAFILVYYFGREMINPGYLQEVWDNELGGRFGGVIEGHQHPFDYYFSRTVDWQFVPWIFLLPLSLLIGLWQFKDTIIAKLSWFLFLNASVFMLFISVSQTKLGWYNAPAFPLMALLVGIGLAGLLKALQQLMFPEEQSWRNTTIVATFLIAIFALPYYKIIEKVYRPVDTEWNKEGMYYEHFMEQVHHHGDYKVASTGYNGHLEFHVFAENYRGKHLKMVVPKAPYVKVDDLVMVCEPRIQKALQKNFRYTIEQQWKSCAMIRITGEVEQETDEQ